MNCLGRGGYHYELQNPWKVDTGETEEERDRDHEKFGRFYALPVEVVFERCSAYWGKAGYDVVTVTHEEHMKYGLHIGSRMGLTDRTQTGRKL